MNPRQRMLWRAAVAIAEAYARHRETPPPLTETLPVAAVTRLVRLAEHARSREYRTASSRLCPRLERALRDLANVATSQADRLRSERRFTQPPLAGTLYWDLRAIDDELPKFEIDFKRQLILVGTDPIELDGVSLGSFMICLDWEKLGFDQPDFEVMALFPNPPSSNAGVTHPHVVDDRLCEGEAAHMLRAACLEGRLHDFVLIVRQVLLTYNESSAYAELHSWYGAPCSDCGTHVDSDERCLCGRCDSEMCDECVRSCGSCGDNLCHHCCEECKGCEDYHCRSCLETCRECKQDCCQQCLINGVCDACVSEKEANANEAEAAAVAAAHPLCVGQAPVPA